MLTAIAAAPSVLPAWSIDYALSLLSTATIEEIYSVPGYPGWTNVFAVGLSVDGAAIKVHAAAMFELAHSLDLSSDVIVGLDSVQVIDIEVEPENGEMSSLQCEFTRNARGPKRTAWNTAIAALIKDRQTFIVEQVADVVL